MMGEIKKGETFAEAVERTRKEQGLPPRIDDPLVLARLIGETMRAQQGKK